MDDIKRVLDDIPSSNAPGMDGFNSHFLKTSWDTIKTDIHVAISDFFNSGKILKEFNVTSFTLVPKVSVPASVGDSRPLTCCSLIYKYIFKLMCERLNSVLPNIISPNQGAFVFGRSILHNVLVQDIVKMYRNSQHVPCCIMKLDLRKSYDTIEGGFLEDIMVDLGFPTHFTKLVMNCLTTTQY